MHAPAKTIDHLAQILQQACLERLAPYQPHQREVLAHWFASAGGPKSDPLLEFDPPFEQAPGTWADLVDQGLIHPKTYALLERGGALKGPRPFKHQWQALELASQGQSLAISAGTGSGKTECFLIPILDSLVREALTGRQPLQGLRSLLVYPLNALVADQMGRWRSVLAHQQEVLGFVPIRLGMYNGQLRKNEDLGEDLRPLIESLGLAADDPDLRAYLPMAQGEVVDRADLQAGGRRGATILVTNHVMLELALLRPQDRTWLQQAGAWRHLVLDEAHTYTGGLALDLAMLLRRLRDRIAPAQTPQGFATSATFGGPAGGQDLATFAQSLFGQTPERVTVIQGLRAPLTPEGALGQPWRPEYEKLIAHLAQHQAEAPLRALLFRHSELAEELFPYDLQALAHLDQLLEHLSRERHPDYPPAGTFPGRALLPHRLHAALRRPPQWPSLCLNPACPGTREAAWATAYPGTGYTGLHHSDHRCPHCATPMLYPVACSNPGCAMEGLLAVASAPMFGAPILYHPRDPELQIQHSPVLLVPATRADACAEPGHWFTVAPGGQLLPASAKQSDAWFLLRIQGADLTCPSCHQAWPDQPSPLWHRTFSNSLMVLSALDGLLPEQLPLWPETSHQPQDGRRLLTFSDSRQGTAKLASMLSSSHRFLVVRRWLLDTIRGQGETAGALAELREQQAFLAGKPDLFARQLADLEHQLADLEAPTLAALVGRMPKDQPRFLRWARSLEAPRFERWADRFWQNRFEGKAGARWHAWIAEPSILETARQRLLGDPSGTALGVDAPGILAGYLHWVLRSLAAREVLRAPGRTPNLQRLGLMVPRWAGIRYPLPALAPLGLDADQQQELMEGTLQAILEWGCVEVSWATTLDAEDRSVTFGQGFPKRLHLTSTQPGTVSLLSEGVERRRLSALWEHLRRRIQPAADSARFAREVAERLWDTLGGLNVPWLWSMKDEEGGLRLNLEHLRFQAPSEAFLCARCGAVNLLGRDGTCAQSRYPDRRNEVFIPCGGALKPFDPATPLPAGEDPKPHARQILLQDAAMTGVSVFEHTAQRSGDDRLLDELLFRKGRHNILSSSTTLEAGVDLPDLDAVVLLGVPPAAANHTQRVGRAGRSRARSCLALTLSGEDAFDRWAFRDLKAFLTRPAHAPRIDMSREPALKRHFNAWRLGEVMRGELFRTGQGQDCAQKLEAFACLDPTYRDQARREWLSQHGRPWAGCGAPGWGDDAQARWLNLPEGRLEEVAPLFQRDPALLRVWLEEGAAQLAQLLEELRKTYESLTDQLIASENTQRRFLEARLKDFRTWTAVAWLVRNAFLPSFGFPVAVVNLAHPNAQQRGAHTEPISLPRRQAVFQWVPGASIVVNHRVWTVEGLAFGQAEPRTHRRLKVHYQCPDCEHAFIKPVDQVATACPQCRGTRLLRHSIMEPCGYHSAKVSPMAEKAEATGAELGRRILTLGRGPVAETKNLLSFRAGQEVAFLNIGREEAPGQGAGFVYCSQCHGVFHTPEPNQRATFICPHRGCHQPLGTVEPAYLGDLQHLDVLEIRWPRALEQAEARALAQALRLAAAFHLFLDPRELAVADLNEAQTPWMHLIDLQEGGTGMLARLLTPEASQPWLDTALALLEHRLHADRACVNACPECILTKDNRIEHEHAPFQRQPAAQALRGLLEQGWPGVG